MPKAAKTVNEPASYEVALQELEQLISQIECRGKLQAVQEQVKILDGDKLSAWTQE